MTERAETRFIWWLVLGVGLTLAAFPLLTPAQNYALFDLVAGGATMAAAGLRLWMLRRRIRRTARHAEASGSLALHQTRQLADIAAGVAHEEAAGRPDGIDDPHAEIAQGAERREVVGEKPVEGVG